MDGQLINLFAGILLEEDVNRNYMRIERRRLRDEFNPFDMPDMNFKQMFRLDKVPIHYLLNSLRPHVWENNLGIPFEAKVFATLNFLVTGSYQNVIGCNTCIAISQSPMSRAISQVCELIVQVLMRVVIEYPTTEAEINGIKQGFYDKFNFRGIVGAIDGTHVEISAPPMNDVEYPPFVYIKRKGKYSINVMLISDSISNIIGCSARYPGSTHDSAIWSTSTIRAHLLLKYQQGDTGTRLIVVTHWNHGSSLPSLTLETSTRNVLERTNGILKGRFRCLSRHRTLVYHPRKAANIIYACCILHNIAIGANLDTAENEMEYAEGNDDNIRHEANVNELLDLGRHARDNYIRENILNQ